VVVAVAGSKVRAATLRAAVEHGIRRLEALAPAGRWNGFPTLAGRSDVWVTAFAVAHLRALAPRHPLIATARRYLAQEQQASGGWGYGGRGVPADADSTAWCLQALGSSRDLSTAARARAFAFLETHRTERGFSTYHPDSGIRAFIEASHETSVDGWTRTHPDVTAAVLLAGHPPRRTAKARALLQRLMASQTAAGLIEAYWWRSAFYALTMTLRVFRDQRLRPSPTFVLRALAALEAKRLPDGGYGLGADPSADAFTTAMALEAQSLLTNRNAAAPAVDALLSAQKSDGGWEGALVLRIPAPSVTSVLSVHGWKANTGGGNSFVNDDDGVFATTLACHALALHLSKLEGRFAGLDKAWPELAPAVVPHDDGAITVPVVNPPELERCDV
jgi:hypothetical protein